MIKKLIRIVLLLVSIFSILVPYMFIKPVYLFPTGIIDNGYASSDSEHGGNSICELIQHTNSAIEYKSHLRSKYKFPYTGYSLSFNTNKLSFKPRNRLYYDITSTVSKTLRINIGVRVKSKDNFIYESAIDTDKESKGRVIPLSYFKPAQWWYDVYQLTEKDFPPPTMDNISHFSIVSGAETPIDIQEIIKISKIKVYMDPLPFIFISITAFLLLIFLQLREIALKSKSSKNYMEIDLQANGNLEEDIIIKYIGENYTRSDLSVDIISEDTGISKYKIPKIIKEKFNLTVPGYLNEIRMKEIKRLLVETDLPVLDLSLSVGYNTVSHFNRTFKNREGVSPLNYRKKYQKKSNLKNSQ